ncbi:unnamed protein product [Ilex paraguariensis]|uniref:Uncharacterized protein n=1 Tax=Ilex paraguariensis TaxID=185542 RepID=A0ABC8R1S6_9AQUA
MNVTYVTLGLLTLFLGFKFLLRRKSNGITQCSGERVVERGCLCASNPEKAIEARPGLDSSSRILKGHQGPSGSPRRLLEAGNHRMDNQSERYTCLGYCSSSGEMEGRKAGESTTDGVEKGFDLAGVDNNSFLELLVLPNASSPACKTSGISTSECVVGDSTRNIPGNLEKTDDFVYQLRQKNDTPCGGNEGSELHIDEKSEDNIGLESFMVSTPSEKQNARKRRNNGIGLSKKPWQRHKVTKYRPKVVVEGQPAKNPKPRPPNPSTLKPLAPKPSTLKPQNSEPSTPKLQTPKPSTPMNIISKKSPQGNWKYIRKACHKALANKSEDVVDEQTLDPYPQHATRSCRRALSFNLENQVRDENDIKEIVVLKRSPKEKHSCITNNCLKAQTKSSEDVGETVHPNPENGEKPCLQALSFKLENHEKEENDVIETVAYKRSPDEKIKDIRNTSLKAPTNSFEYVVGQVVDPYPVHPKNLYGRTLNVNLESQGRDGNDARKIIHQYQRRGKSVDKSACDLDFNLNLESQEVSIGMRSPEEKIKYRRNSNLKAPSNSFEDVDGRVVGPCPVHPENTCRRTLNVNLENQGRDGNDARKIVHQYQRRGKRVDKSACHLDFNLNLESQEVSTGMNNKAEIGTTTNFKNGDNLMVENLPGIAYGFTDAKSCSHMDVSLAERGAAIYQKDLPATTQFGCMYQRRSQRNQCLNYSRKLGPNFPTIYKKRRMRRQKAIGDPESFKGVLTFEDTHSGQKSVALDIEGCSPQCMDVLLNAERTHDVFVGALVGYAIHKPECLHISDDCDQLVVPVQSTHGALIPYKGHFVPSRKHKSPPNVDLDSETMRALKLLTEKEGSEGVQEVNEDKEKWWEEQREIFCGRVDSFIARMHLIQGITIFHSAFEVTTPLLHHEEILRKWNTVSAFDHDCIGFKVP